MSRFGWELWGGLKSVDKEEEIEAMRGKEKHIVRSELGCQQDKKKG